jgi:hypothetical protein
MKKIFHHGEHGGHGGMERDAGLEFFVAGQPINLFAMQKLFFPSVSSVLSVVNLLPYSHDPRHR